MIGLDTNVLVRFFTQDDPVQFRQAQTFIQDELSADEPGYINLVVLAEFAWTLARAYKFTKDEIAGAIEALLGAAEISIQYQEAVAGALSLCETENIDFVDALIAVVNRDAGCRETRTFDVRLASSNAATLLGR